MEELYIPREKADFLLKDDAILRDIQYQVNIGFYCEISLRKVDIHVIYTEYMQ